jgi:hypothetical protein
VLHKKGRGIEIIGHLAKEVVGDAEVVLDGDAVVDSDRPRQGLDTYVSPSPARRYRGHLRRGGSSSPTDEDPDGSLLQSAVGLWGGGRRSTGGNKGGVRLAKKEGKRVGRRAS